MFPLATGKHLVQAQPLVYALSAYTGKIIIIANLGAFTNVFLYHFHSLALIIN